VETERGIISNFYLKCINIIQLLDHIFLYLRYKNVPMNSIAIGFAVLAIVAGILVGAGNLWIIASAEQPDDPDCWGEESSELAQEEDDQPGSGEHASDPIPGDDDRETPRSGIGNLGLGHPSEVGEALNEGDCEED
jgi:hypothetical protein